MMMRRFRHLFLSLIMIASILIGFRVYSNLKRVLSFEAVVEEILAEQASPVEPDLVLAIIYTESKGREVDVMQASESWSGQQNTISDSRTSIERGVEVLTSNLAQAEDQGVDYWTGVQAYNYGEAYIAYIAENGGRSTIDLSRAYSRDLVAPSLGNTDGQTYAYYNPVALFYGGAKLYENGGNIYYAKEVAFNRFLINIVKEFQ